MDSRNRGATFFAAVDYRRTKQQDVRHRYNERHRDMFHTHRTEVRAKDKTVRFKLDNKRSHIIARGGKEITDRVRQDQRTRAKKYYLSKPKNVGESVEYLQNKKLIHDAHAEAAGQLAGKERHPELKVLDRHRQKKHQHASAIIDRLIDLHKKNKKK